MAMIMNENTHEFFHIIILTKNKLKILEERIFCFDIIHSNMNRVVGAVNIYYNLNCIECIIPE